MENLEKIKDIVFAEDSLEESFDKLKEGKFEEKELYSFIEKAMQGIL